MLIQTRNQGTTTANLSTTQDYIELEERYGANNYHPLDVVITKGEGVWVWDIEGKKYLDFLSASRRYCSESGLTSGDKLKSLIFFLDYKILTNKNKKILR